MVDNPQPTAEVIDGKHITWEPRLFLSYVRPAGWLEKDTTCHALFFYYLQAHLSYENNLKDPMFLEGHKDADTDFKQLFKSIARMYGCEPEEMLRFWPAVDMQCGKLKLPILPDRYKFNQPVEVNTNG